MDIKQFQSVNLPKGTLKKQTIHPMHKIMLNMGDDTVIMGVFLLYSKIVNKIQMNGIQMHKIKLIECNT